MQQQLPNFARALACTLIVALVGASTFLTLSMNFDHWDGVIYDFAAQVGDYSGVYEMHWQVGGAVQWFVFKLVEWGHNIFGHVMWSAYGLFSLALFGLGVVYVVRALSGQRQSLWIAILAAALLPLASLVTSSMNATVYLFLGLGLIGAGLMSEKSWHARIAGILLVYCGMQVGHAAPAFMGLGLLVLVVHRLDRFGGDLTWQKILVHSFLLGVVLVATFTLGRVLFPPYGLYAGYGAVNPPAPGVFFRALMGDTLRIGTALLFVVIPLGVAVLYAMWRERYARRTEKIKRICTVLVGLAVVCILNALPFVLTGRSVYDILEITTFGAGFEDFRYSLFGIGLAQIVLGVLLNFVCIEFRPSFPTYILAGIPVFLGLILFVWGWSEMRELDITKQEIVTFWNKQATAGNWAVPGACRIPTDDPIVSVAEEVGYHFRLYDLNYLAFEATGSADNFICSGDCDPVSQLSLVEQICMADAASMTYVFGDIDCSTLIGQLSGFVAMEKTTLPTCY